MYILSKYTSILYTFLDSYPVSVMSMHYDPWSLEIFLNAKEVFCIIYYTSERKAYNKSCF